MDISILWTRTRRQFKAIMYPLGQKTVAAEQSIHTSMLYFAVSDGSMLSLVYSNTLATRLAFPYPSSWVSSEKYMRLTDSARIQRH